MPVLKSHGTPSSADVRASGQIVTSLYDLMESLHLEAAPGEDELVIAAMKHLMNTQQLTFLGLHHGRRVMCA